MRSVARNTQPRWLLMPGATSSGPSGTIELGPQAGLLAQLARGELGGLRLVAVEVPGAVPCGNSHRRNPIG